MHFPVASCFVGLASFVLCLGPSVSSSVSVNQLFPLGLLLGLSGVLFWLGRFVCSIPFTILQCFFCAHFTWCILVLWIILLPYLRQPWSLSRMLRCRCSPSLLPLYMLPRPLHSFPAMPARLPNVNFHLQPHRISTFTCCAHVSCDWSMVGRMTMHILRTRICYTTE